MVKEIYMIGIKDKEFRKLKDRYNFIKYDKETKRYSIPKDKEVEVWTGYKGVERAKKLWIKQLNSDGTVILQTEKISIRKENKKFHVTIKIKEIVHINAKELFYTYGQSAGSNHGWIK